MKVRVDFYFYAKKGQMPSVAVMWAAIGMNPGYLVYSVEWDRNTKDATLALKDAGLTVYFGTSDTKPDKADFSVPTKKCKAKVTMANNVSTVKYYDDTCKPDDDYKSYEVVQTSTFIDEDSDETYDIWVVRMQQTIGMKTSEA